MTAWRLGFSHRLDYSRFAALSLPLAISSSLENRIQLRCQLDTRSTFCVFQRKHGEALGLKIEDGIEQRIGTATGSFLAYGHDATLTIGHLEWQATVYFAEDLSFPINVVGRLGFLDRLQVGIVDYEQLLYLAAYDEV